MSNSPLATGAEPKAKPASTGSLGDLAAPLSATRVERSRPRLGFLGVGWIGRHRMEAIAQAGVAEIAAIAEPNQDLFAKASALAPEAECVSGVEELVEADLDGVVIATPSALHAAQSIRALDQGLAVFCQKPLGRSAAETTRVVRAAKEQDLLLGVDLSYRFMAGTRLIRELCQDGSLGEIYAIELTFHNAYGPDKDWFYDRNLSGGGCVIDLGIHLVDLAFWCLGCKVAKTATASLFSQGKALRRCQSQVEDFAMAQLQLSTGAVLQLSCSWKVSAGCDAVISGSFYGTRGGAGFRNVNGSFYDFVAERYQGTRRTILSDTPEPWGGRAAVDWAQRLNCGKSFDPEIESVIHVAEALDSIYESGFDNSPALVGEGDPAKR